MIELTKTEQFLVELLQHEDARAEADRRVRWTRLAEGIAARTSIPLSRLSIDPLAGEVRERIDPINLDENQD